MPKCYCLLYGLLAILFLPLNGCQKDKPATDPTPTSPTTKITFYTNQTGNPTAEALQVQVLDPVKKLTLNVYGTFDADNKPLNARSITVQKTGNDTTAHLLLNALTHQVETLYLDVKGVKQVVVLKATYIPTDASSMRLGLYTYDWQTNQGTLKSEAVYRRATTSALPTFAANRTLGMGAWLDGFTTAVASVALTEATLFYLTGAGYLITPALIAAVAPVAAVVGTFALNVALMAYIMDMIVTNANAAEPETTPYPASTPPQHPSTVPAPASLPASPCGSTNLNFTTSMDSFGSILITGVTGGTGPYSYSIGGRAFQVSELFANNYAAGSYIVAVRSAAGCVSTRLVSLIRALPCLPEDRLKLLTGGNSKTWRLSAYEIYSQAMPTSNPSSYTIMAPFIPTMTFKVDGTHTQNWGQYDYPTQSPRYRIQEATGGQGQGGNFCRQALTEQVRLYGVAGWEFDELTATKLVFAFPNPNGNRTKLTLVAQ